MSSSIDDGRPRVVSGEAFTDVQHSEEFQELRRRHRSFVFPMTAFFLAWYFLYVLLADYAHDFMSTEVVGQHQRRPAARAAASSSPRSLITTIYVRWANQNARPAGRAICATTSRAELR